MIPIKEAISTGAWLYYEFSFGNKSFQFRFKILSFRKLNLKDVDSPKKIDLKDEGTIICIMDLEVINITKEPISTGELNQLVLVDQDGFTFHVFDDSHLRCDSAFAKKSKLERFYGEKLIPKIKAIGAIPFQLPDDDYAVYSLSIRQGSIREA